jgi:hypothetical protein
MKLLTAWLSLVSLVLVSGCAAEQPDDIETLGDTQGAILGENGLDTNGLDTNSLDTNGLDTNGLDTNGLDTNGLDTNSLDASALAAIQDPSDTGTASRRLMRYLVTCALKRSDVFAFSWTDTSGVVHEETYRGYLGLAPEWAKGPLSERGKHLVTGCLAAHVNYYSEPVVISIRSGQDPLRP